MGNTPMNETQRGIARELVKCPQWVWPDGIMVVTNDDRLLPLGRSTTASERKAFPASTTVTAGGNEYPPEMCLPDLTDMPTGGALLDMQGPGWMAWEKETGGRCYVFPNGKVDTQYGTTLAEACARALVAKWSRASFEWVDGEPPMDGEVYQVEHTDPNRMGSPTHVRWVNRHWFRCDGLVLGEITAWFRVAKPVAEPSFAGSGLCDGQLAMLDNDKGGRR